MEAEESTEPPADRSGVFRQALDFPEFNLEANEWKSHFMLMPDNRWAGRFQGVILKPPGQRSSSDRELNEIRTESLKVATDWLSGPETCMTSTPYIGNDRWIEYQFRNLSDKDISIGRGRIVQADVEGALEMYDIPADGNYHGFIAHNFKGSAYRPESDTKLRLEWGPGRFSPKHEQVLKFPKFDPEVKNWYCYYTLHPDHTWTAEFEGVVTSDE